MRAGEVVEETMVRVLTSPGIKLPLRLCMSYRADDPFAVTFTFMEEDPDSSEQVGWSFARNLMVQGLVEPAGEADVKFHPFATTLQFTLSSPDGTQAFELDRAAAAAFIDQTYTLVPLGTEEERVNWDAEIQGLLA